MMGYVNGLMLLRVFMVLVAIFGATTCRGLTDPRDVFAINSLYAALGSPPLLGWVPTGGDPCGPQPWQGVLCVNSNITGIVLNGVNVGGELGVDLGSFASIIELDLSNNHIGGSIPSNLPITLRTLYLSTNQLIGSIPDTLSSIAQVTDLSLNNNNLTGVIPDAFQQLTGLINLDLSGNTLSGQLPPSMGNLLSLTTLHLQDNDLSGALDILQNLPLNDLDIENNLFSGPIPPKLLNIPNFRRAGNPFNTTIIASPPTIPPSSSAFGPLPPEVVPGIQANGPAAPVIVDSHRGQMSQTTKRIMVYAVAGFIVFIVFAVVLCLCLSRCCKGKPASNNVAKMTEEGALSGHKENPKRNESLPKPDNHTKKVKKEVVMRPGVDHAIDMTVFNENILPQPPSSLSTFERKTVQPTMPKVTGRKDAIETVNSATCFTIASLQQYTDSFSQEYLIGGGMLGTVYRAELPNGKLLAVKKLDVAASKKQSDEDFLELVSNVSKLKHVNVVEFVGYCAEYGQRLLVHKYCGNGSLYEALHLEDEIHKKLTWNARMRLALQAARSLKYLHEVCQPPVVHQNFKSANILLDDDLTARVSDCGLAPLISSNYMTQFQGCGYGAPELEVGSYTYQSDVYSFGVVMLELLTGRKSYDRSRPRGEQYLVRWAIHQLHDIDALSSMVDPSLNGTYPSKSLSRFADIISLCIQPEPEFRPPMSEIVQNLVHMI